MTSNSGWLYEVDGEVFGPISSKELLEELYQGEIDAQTAVRPEDGVFKPIRDYEVFKPHIQKANSHQAQAAEYANQAKLDGKSRFRRRLIFVGLTVMLALVGFAITIYTVRAYRSEKVAQETELQLESKLANLLDRISIEPPLILESPESSKNKRRSKKRRRRRKSRTAEPELEKTVVRRTGKLSQSEVMAGVGTVFGGFRRCIVRQIQRDSESVPRKVVLRFTIDNDGRVKSPDLDDRILRNSPMMHCMRQKITSVKFRKFKGEVRNVEYPITVGAH